MLAAGSGTAGAQGLLLAPVEPPVGSGHTVRPALAQVRTPGAAPAWDEASSRFWCSTGVNAYDLPDGREWQRAFRELLETRMAMGCGRRLQAHVSDAPTPLALRVESAGRRLARFPSDPDKRRARATHTAALLQMPWKAGVEAWVQGRRIAFFRFGGRVFAADARCPHQGASLCEGEVGDIEDMVDGQCFYVTCPVHKMQFDLATGSVLEGDCPPLQTYSVRIHEADEVRRVAMIEVGFEALASEYFAGGEDMDISDPWGHHTACAPRG